MTTVTPRTDIVIPTFNGRAMLEGCLDSIRCQTLREYAVTVVDNGSTDGTIDALRDRFPEVRLVAMGRNTGFSAAVNAGIRAGSAPLVFLLNNDTELAADCLQQLIEAADREPAAAFFAARMLSFRQREILDGAGEGFLRGGAGYRLGTMEPYGSPYDQERTVFGACAGAALYRRELLAEIGLFDEDFFAYLEDVDFNLRARRAGATCRYVPAARVYHIGSATTGSKFNDLTIRLSTRNSFYVLLKNYPLAMLLRLAPVILVYQVLWLLFVVKKGQLRPYWAGITDMLGNASSVRRKFHAAAKGQGLADGEFAAVLALAECEVIDSIMRRRALGGKGNGLLRLYRRLFL